jgi:tRNA(Ile)-lysidine synthase
MSSRKLSVIGRFLATVEENRLISSGDRVLVAVSGGADSVCLLDLLRLVAGRFQLRLVGFHMNHGLRSSSRNDEAFVRRMFDEWQLELRVIRTPVARYARRHRLGIEEAGRILRYHHMERLAAKLDCQRIALGHTANDNLETMLLNMVRGAGLSGLAGMPVWRGRFIRPLLDLERRDVERHLRSRGIEWVEDASNQDVRFRRNLLRHKVVPILEQVNPAAVANARRAARLLVEENGFLEALTAEVVEKAANVVRGSVQIDTRKFSNYNNVLKRRVLKRLLPELDSDAVETVLRFAKREAGGRLCLVAGVSVRLRRGIIEFQRPKEILDNA